MCPVLSMCQPHVFILDWTFIASKKLQGPWILEVFSALKMANKTCVASGFLVSFLCLVPCYYLDIIPCRTGGNYQNRCRQFSLWSSGSWQVFPPLFPTLKYPCIDLFFRLLFLHSSAYCLFTIIHLATLFCKQEWNHCANKHACL